MKLEFWSFQDSRQLNIHFLTLNTDSHFILQRPILSSCKQLVLELQATLKRE